MDKKEEILERHIQRFKGLPIVEAADAYNSMDAYSEEQAIAFAEFISREGWQQYDGADRWINANEGNAVLGTKKLYEKFLNHQHVKL